MGKLAGATGRASPPWDNRLEEKRKTRQDLGLRGREGLACLSRFIQGFQLPVYGPQTWVIEVLTGAPHGRWTCQNKRRNIG